MTPGEDRVYRIAQQEIHDLRSLRASIAGALRCVREDVWNAEQAVVYIEEQIKKGVLHTNEAIDRIRREPQS